MNKLIVFIACILAVLLVQVVFAADTDSTHQKKELKNTVRVNITNPIIFGSNSMIAGYERVLGPTQTFSVNVGRFSLPKLSLFDFGGTDSINLTKNSTEKGYHASFDYRFYLAKENRNNAPRGVYLAPYFSYNFFERTNTWTLNTSSFQGDLNTTFNLDIAALGGELGYQFVLWRRLAIDFILIGPGMARYSFKTKLSTTLSADDESELFDRINDFLAEKIPGYKLVIDDAEYKKSGSTKTTTFGFRYMIHLGFRF
jgi:hypothetical protein